MENVEERIYTITRQCKVRAKTMNEALENMPWLKGCGVVKITSCKIKEQKHGKSKRRTDSVGI